jgi:hypothetical protein
MITVCWRDPRERPEKHDGQTFSIKPHQQRNDRYYDLNESWRVHIKIHYNSMDKRWIYSIKMLSMVPLNVVDASDEDQSSPYSNSDDAAARPQRPRPCGDLRRLSDEWMSTGNHLGAPRGLYLCPWGALGRAPPCLARDPPWERSKLGFHKISLVQIFVIHSPSLSAPYLPRPDSK